MSENKDNKLTLINEKTANDYLTHTEGYQYFISKNKYGILFYLLYQLFFDEIRNRSSKQIMYYCGIYQTYSK